MIFRFLIFFSSLLYSTSVQCQSIDEIVRKIEKNNSVQSKHIGIAGSPSKNYINFKNLKEKADNSDLLKLINHKNSVVSCYATLGLIDKKYSNLPVVFILLLKSDKTVHVQDGCVGDTYRLSEKFYEYYLETIKSDISNSTLRTMDSLILWSDNPSSKLLKNALNNKTYPKSYNENISKIAFEKNNLDAVFYLDKWYSIEYKTEIKNFLVDHLSKMNFDFFYSPNEYHIISTLLAYNDETIKDKVINKIKSDKNWNGYKDKYKTLLEKYKIYDSHLR